MIKIYTAFISMMFILALAPLEAQNSLEHALSEAEEMPYFPGCEFLKSGSLEKRQCSNQNVVAYISEKLQYPESARNSGLEGTVYASFVVDERGMVKNPVLIRDLGEGCGEEALRVLNSMPRWEPAIDAGKSVAVQLTMRVQFSLSEEQRDISDDYTLSWGLLKGEQTSKSSVLNNSAYPIAVRDQYGNELNINELSFIYQKNNRSKEVKSNGKLSKAQRQLLRKIKKGGDLSITAVVQDKGKFVTVGRTWVIER